MLSSLQFVKGAVSKKDFVPALTHFRIKDGRISGFNGKMMLSAPISLDIDCCPKATSFVRALEACSDTIQLHLTPSGKLAIRSGKFRAHVETLDEAEFPGVEPEGINVTVDNGGLLPAMSTMLGFMADDASRPWSNGLLLDGESAFATNNVILAEYRLGCHFPYRVNVPRYAIKEMVRLGEEPLHMQISENSITFHYQGERWLKAQLISMPWPETSANVFSRLPSGPLPPIPEGFWDALETLTPFTDEGNRIHVLGDRLATATDEGASIELDMDVPEGIYGHKMLSRLEGIATNMNLSAYPAPVPWYGVNVRGLIMGMKS